jgi:hypothetical protein
MRSRKPDRLLRNILVASIVVLAVGFLGLGVRASATVVATHLAFLAVSVISIAILVCYLVLRQRTRRLNSHSVPLESPRAKRPLLRRPDTR